MTLVKFGDLPPGTIWRLPDDDGWWLKVDASHVYTRDRRMIPGDLGWSIRLGCPGGVFTGSLCCLFNGCDVIVWDGKEDLNVQGS